MWLNQPMSFHDIFHYGPLQRDCFHSPKNGMISRAAFTFQIVTGSQEMGPGHTGAPQSLLKHDFYLLVMTNIAMVFRWPIEIDGEQLGLPFLIAWWWLPWRTVSHSQRVIGRENGKIPPFQWDDFPGLHFHWVDGQMARWPYRMTGKWSRNLQNCWGSFCFGSCMFPQPVQCHLVENSWAEAQCMVCFWRGKV